MLRAFLVLRLGASRLLHKVVDAVPDVLTDFFPLLMILVEVFAEVFDKTSEVLGNFASFSMVTKRMTMMTSSLVSFGLFFHPVLSRLFPVSSLSKSTEGILRAIEALIVSLSVLKLLLI